MVGLDGRKTHDDDEIPPNWRTGKTHDVVTDVCSHCGRSGREIAKSGHDINCLKFFDTPQSPLPSLTLPTDYHARKALPLYDFMFGYFPLAWLEVVKVAVAGNDQHNPGEKLHWAREKSTDQLNTAMRHLFDHGMGTQLDTDGCYHLAKVIWRLSAELQLIVERNKS